MGKEVLIRVMKSMPIKNNWRVLTETVKKKIDKNEKLNNK